MIRVILKMDRSVKAFIFNICYYFIDIKIDVVFNLVDFIFVPKKFKCFEPVQRRIAMN